MMSLRPVCWPGWKRTEMRNLEREQAKGGRLYMFPTNTADHSKTSQFCMHTRVGDVGTLH